MFLDLSIFDIIYWFPVKVDEGLPVLQGTAPLSPSSQYN